MIRSSDPFITGTARRRPCFFMFENRRQPLLPLKVFYVRFARVAGIGLLIILGSLAVGMEGIIGLSGCRGWMLL